MENKIDLAVNIAGLSLKNPVIAASGTFGFGREYSAFFDLSRLGGIAVKGLTLLPRKGNPPPRIAETPAGILNSVGLQNPGVHAFIDDEIPFLRRYDTAIIANASGNTVEDYEEMVRILSEADVDAIELNLSCPNVKEGCMAFGSTASGIARVVSRVRKLCKKPLIVKLTPNVTDICELACAAEAAGADALSLINTLLGMAIDAKTRRPILGNVMGGLSGPAVKPVALRMVYQVSKAVKIPVIGMGGISNGTDVVEFLLAGASAVMVGTAGFVNPYAWVQAIEGLEQYMVENNCWSVSELIGGLIL
ncbi:MAG: dihydroorotate dehydrogenase [Clostridiaceae bacterium]|jgi:dihydroorotate dehydrogenase (NAD+) catalytic subunit|nr:dihydroorotate dehydrogenase [Bacillota bacterium]NLI38993.1 dihydroorotate dehydrogenase [Clostridiaceae bacterium]